MVKISNASYENEVHTLDSPFNDDSKNIIFFGQGGPNFGGGTTGKFGEMARAGKPIVTHIREWSILMGNTGLYSLVSNSLHYFCFPAC